MLERSCHSTCVFSKARSQTLKNLNPKPETVCKGPFFLLFILAMRTSEVVPRPSPSPARSSSKKASSGLDKLKAYIS